MSYTLVGNEVDYNFNNRNWSVIRAFAEHYGDWEPAGTTAPEWLSNHVDPDWDGNYHTNDSQRVTGTDANNLADALDKAINDVDVAIDPHLPELVLELLTEDGKDYVRRFIQWVRAQKGGFLLI